MLLLLIEAAKCCSQLVGFLLSEVVFSLSITGTSIGTLVTRIEGWGVPGPGPASQKGGGARMKKCVNVSRHYEIKYCFLVLADLNIHDKW